MGKLGTCKICDSTELRKQVDALFSAGVSCEKTYLQIPSIARNLIFKHHKHYTKTKEEIEVDELVADARRDYDKLKDSSDLVAKGKARTSLHDIMKHRQQFQKTLKIEKREEENSNLTLAQKARLSLTVEETDLILKHYETRRLEDKQKIASLDYLITYSNEKNRIYEMMNILVKHEELIPAVFSFVVSQMPVERELLPLRSN